MLATQYGLGIAAAKRSFSAGSPPFRWQAKPLKGQDIERRMEAKIDRRPIRPPVEEHELTGEAFTLHNKVDELHEGLETLNRKVDVLHEGTKSLNRKLDKIMDALKAMGVVKCVVE